jgi:Tol biopolymer transport system component
MIMKTLGRLIGEKRMSNSRGMRGCFASVATILICVVAAQLGSVAYASPALNGDAESVLFYLDPPPTPTRKPFHTPTATAVGEPTPLRLTEGGCCPYPSWSPDSLWVPFLDRPGPYEPTGLYAVAASGGEVAFIVERAGTFSRDWSRVAYIDGGRTFVERWVNGERWEIPNEGRSIRFSPSGQMIMWEVTSRGIEYPDLRQKAIWLANSDGTDAREVVSIMGGDFVGWVNGEQAIIVTGRLAPYGPSGIWRISIVDGAGQLFLEMDRVRSPLMSLKGDWIAFMVAFDTQEERNGLWVMRTDGSFSKKLEMFGAYRWRREGVLLVIPLDLESPGPTLWQVDVLSGETWRLIDPSITSLQIASNDWQPSPDGEKIVFRSAEDQNLWVLELPDP